ncbi:hypothetical protein [Lysobacter capsici]|uniref:hypothetical protein n=1 Tax=Lysobacter capsici TaxID=435897 RepID=UPI0006275858|nr:hypothetical protein [Lysobacter capsici]
MFKKNALESGRTEIDAYTNGQNIASGMNEGGVPNILLGKGAGIEIFRSNIVGYTVVSQGQDK